MFVMNLDILRGIAQANIGRQIKEICHFKGIITALLITDRKDIIPLDHTTRLMVDGHPGRTHLIEDLGDRMIPTGIHQDRATIGKTGVLMERKVQVNQTLIKTLLEQVISL